MKICIILILTIFVFREITVDLVVLTQLKNEISIQIKILFLIFTSLTYN